MPTSTELYFARLIAECRSAFDGSRSGFLRWLGVKGRPDGSEDVVAGQLQPHYQILAAKGRVVWGGIAQVNMRMFSTGSEDLPGVTVYSTDSYYDAHPHDLAAIGRACFQFKNTVPADPEFRVIAERLTDEFDQTARMSIPQRLADRREVFMGATMFHRARLPGKVLRAGAFPMVIAPDLTEMNMVLPVAYWSRKLREAWGELQGRLEDSPITTTAHRVARDAEKQPLESTAPHWDVESMPVYVTPAMAAQLDAHARELGLDARPMLAIGLRPDGGKFADLVPGHDPNVEAVFNSNGVSVVVRRDQLERLRGTVVDFKSSAFATGVVIRLPGE